MGGRLFGTDGVRGLANADLTPEVALNAAKLVKTGKTYSLGAETNARTPAFPPRNWALVGAIPSAIQLGPVRS